METFVNKESSEKNLPYLQFIRVFLSINYHITCTFSFLHENSWRLFTKILIIKLDKLIYAHKNVNYKKYSGRLINFSFSNNLNTVN